MDILEEPVLVGELVVVLELLVEPVFVGDIKLVFVGPGLRVIEVEELEDGVRDVVFEA